MSAEPSQVRATATETVVVLAKSPVPGRVKTRLTPTFTPSEAAALATAAIRDTFDAVAEAVANRSVRQTVIAWDGPVTPWLPPEARVLGQRGEGLDERLQNVFDDLLAGATDRPTLLVGMDTPQLRAVDLDLDWGDADALLGMSHDGGYWCIGLRRPQPDAIRGVPMSTDHTGADQLLRLQSLGLRVRLLPTLLDVDEPADALEVARLAPDSRFGRLHRRLTETPCHPSTLFDAAMGGVEVRVHRGPLHAHANARSARDGCRPLDVSAWSSMSSADELIVSRCEGPVLDIGCGPGRFVEALASRGIPRARRRHLTQCHRPDVPSGCLRPLSRHQRTGSPARDDGARCCSPTETSASAVTRSGCCDGAASLCGPGRWLWSRPALTMQRTS